MRRREGKSIFFEAKSYGAIDEKSALNPYPIDIQKIIFSYLLTSIEDLENNRSVIPPEIFRVFDKALNVFIRPFIKKHGQNLYHDPRLSFSMEERFIGTIIVNLLSRIQDRSLPLQLEVLINAIYRNKNKEDFEVKEENNFQKDVNLIHFNKNVDSIFLKYSGYQKEISNYILQELLKILNKLIESTLANAFVTTGNHISTSQETVSPSMEVFINMDEKRLQKELNSLQENICCKNRTLCAGLFMIFVIIGAIFMLVGVAIKNKVLCFVGIGAVGAGVLGVFCRTIKNWQTINKMHEVSEERSVLLLPVEHAESELSNDEEQKMTTPGSRIK